MVSITDEQRKQYIKELSEAVEAIRVKYGAESCKHGEAQGVSVTIFYPKGWSHTTMMGNFSAGDIIAAVLRGINQMAAKQAEGAEIPVA